jgi:hypothetical protein
MPLEGFFGNDTAQRGVSAPQPLLGTVGLLGYELRALYIEASQQRLQQRVRQRTQYDVTKALELR